MLHVVNVRHGRSQTSPAATHIPTSVGARSAALTHGSCLPVRALVHTKRTHHQCSSNIIVLGPRHILQIKQSNAHVNQCVQIDPGNQPPCKQMSIHRVATHDLPDRWMDCQCLTAGAPLMALFHGSQLSTSWEHCQAAEGDCPQTGRVV